MVRSSVSIIRALIAAALLFWISFVSNLRYVMAVQVTAEGLLRLWPKEGDRATLRIDLRLPSPDPLVAEFVLVVPAQRPYAEVERVRSSGVVDLAWMGEPGEPRTWRAVALDRAGCIVYAGVVMWSLHSTSQMDTMEMPLRQLDVPLCTLGALQARGKPAAMRESQ